MVPMVIGYLLDSMVSTIELKQKFDEMAMVTYPIELIIHNNNY